MSSLPPYVNPVPEAPARLSLQQFIQTVIVGLSALPGPMVVPNWQPEPPQQENLGTNWIGFGIQSHSPDASAYLHPNATTQQLETMRMEAIEIELQIYGPNCEEVYGLFRDGFQVPQNRIALYQANMNFKEISSGRHIPDLVNQRWIDRVVCSIVLQRQIQRTYPVLTFLSASGIIYIPDVKPGYELTF